MHTKRFATSCKVPVAAAGIAAAASSVRTRNNLAHSRDDANNSRRRIGVWLTQKGESDIAAHFSTKMHSKRLIEAKCAVLKNDSNDRDSYYYEPLFGESCAFRLKGLISTEDGFLVGVGRISSMIGEIYDDHHEVSLLLSPRCDCSAEREAELLELPTVLKAMDLQIGDEIDDLGCGIWEGKLSKKTMLGIQYGFEGVTYTKLPWFKQIVVEGKLCDSKYVDSSGSCLFERMSITTARESNPTEVSSNTMQASASKLEEADLISTSAREERRAECPICAFMSKGSCNLPFEQWVKCIDSAGNDAAICEELKVLLATCMIQDEYYDIFVAKFT